MTKVIIYNLKKCFDDGVTFKDLAEFEQRVQDPNNYFGEIPLKDSFAEFVQAKINKEGDKTIFYNYIPNGKI